MFSIADRLFVFPFKIYSMRNGFEEANYSKFLQLKVARLMLVMLQRCSLPGLSKNISPFLSPPIRELDSAISVCLII